MNVAIDPQLPSLFFRTPLEIRYRIYEFTLDAEQPIPANLDEANKIIRCRNYVRSSPGPCLQYPTSYENPYLCLLLLCKKTCVEVGELQSSQKSKTKLFCKLDLIINRIQAIPTWIIPPRRVKDVEYDLEVSLRLFDFTSAIPLFGSDGWVGTISAPLMAILNHLVHYGPRFLPSAHLPRPEPMRFNAITMDVTSPSSKDVGPCEIYDSELAKRALRGVFGFMCLLESSGLLGEKVRWLRIYSLQVGQGECVEVTNYDPTQTVPARWADAGYKWGRDV